MEDQSLRLQNEDAFQNAGPAGGLGDRSGVGSNNPGRSGAGAGINADDLRTPTSGATDPSLDENEASYGNREGVEEMPETAKTDREPNDADDASYNRNFDEGSADSRGKSEFLDIENRE